MFYSIGDIRCVFHAAESAIKRIEYEIRITTPVAIAKLGSVAGFLLQEEGMSQCNFSEVYQVCVAAHYTAYLEAIMEVFPIVSEFIERTVSDRQLIDASNIKINGWAINDVAKRVDYWRVKYDLSEEGIEDFNQITKCELAEIEKVYCDFLRMVTDIKNIYSHNRYYKLAPGYSRARKNMQQFIISAMLGVIALALTITAIVGSSPHKLENFIIRLIALTIGIFALLVFMFHSHGIYKKEIRN